MISLANTLLVLINERMYHGSPVNYVIQVFYINTEFVLILRTVVLLTTDLPTLLQTP